MTENKPIVIDGRECRYWFRLNPTDYRKCALRSKDDNCDEIKDCFIKKLLYKLSRKTQECKQAEQRLERIKKVIGDSRIYKEEDYGLDNITRELLQIIDEVK